MATIEKKIPDFELGNAEFGLVNYQFDTLALHAGTPPDPTTGAILTPIYQTTTYRQEAVGRDKGFTYSRSGNPTVSALEARLAALEGAEFCTCYGTGLAATTALCLALLRAGDRVVVSQAVYGGTVRLFRQVLEPFGVHAEFVDTANEKALTNALKTPTRFVFIETPANPTLKLTDIRLAARLAKEAGALLVVETLPGSNRRRVRLDGIRHLRGLWMPVDASTWVSAWWGVLVCRLRQQQRD